MSGSSLFLPASSCSDAIFWSEHSAAHSQLFCIQAGMEPFFLCYFQYDVY